MSLNKIIFFTTQFGPGGAETQVLRLALTLKEKGYDVSVVSMLEAVGYVDKLDAAEIGYYCLEMKRGKIRPRDIYNLVALLRKLRPDVIANFCFHANVLGSLAGKLTRVPVIITSIRGESSGSRSREYIERVISSSRISDQMVTNSSIVAKTLIERGVVSSRRIKVIYNGIYTEEYAAKNIDRPAIRKQIGIGEEAFCWLAVGNVSVAKDYPTLLRAFALVKEQHPNAQLRVAGGLWYDEVKDELDKLLDQYALHDHVQFLGQRQDVPQLLHAADAFVLSSKTEGLPNAVMEAMATGLPVVATNVGGVRELVENEVSGYVVASLEPDGLSKAMLQVTKLSAEARRQMGMAGQKHIQNTFELEVVCKQWESLFSTHLTTRRSKHFLSRTP